MKTIFGITLVMASFASDWAQDSSISYSGRQNRLNILNQDVGTEEPETPSDVGQGFFSTCIAEREPGDDYASRPNCDACNEQCKRDCDSEYGSVSWRKNQECHDGCDHASNSGRCGDPNAPQPDSIP